MDGDCINCGESGNWCRCDTEKKTIAIDFDDTLTALPAIWNAFIKSCYAEGHTVYLITGRRDTDENRETIRDFLTEHDLPRLPIVFSELGSKIEACNRRGIKPDIWIDDDPVKLVHGH